MKLVRHYRSHATKKIVGQAVLIKSLKVKMSLFFPEQLIPSIAQSNEPLIFM